MSAHTIQRSTPAQQWYRSRGPPADGAGAREEEGQCGNVVEGGSSDVIKADEEGQGGNVVEGGSSDVIKAEEEKDSLPKLPPPSAEVSTPQKRRSDAEEEEVEMKLTSSALRGGAAKGLLSLSQGSL